MILWVLSAKGLPLWPPIHTDEHGLFSWRNEQREARR